MASGPNLLMNMFGRPRGIIGRLGGVIMARMDADCGVWVAGLLEVTPDDAVLEIGFGPGVIIQCLSKLASAGHVAGIDPSPDGRGVAALVVAEPGRGSPPRAIPGA